MNRTYVELECVNARVGCCPNHDTWEVYCRVEPDGEGWYELVPVSDDPTGYLGSLKCEFCNEDGEVL